MPTKSDKNPGQNIVYTTQLKAGRRKTYFFDVRKSENDNYYITITENNKRADGHTERHKIFLFKEDFNRFAAEMLHVIDMIQTELMPDYDYDAVARQAAAYEAHKQPGQEQSAAPSDDLPLNPEDAWEE
jgi:hypothetical protein